MSADITPPPSLATGVPVPALPHLPPSSLLPLTDPGPASARPSKLRRAARFWPVGVLGCAVVGAALWFGRPKTAAADFLTAPVVRGDLPVVVAERGELDSTKSVMVRCDVEGEKSKLVHIVPEGTHVKKDDEVGRFDTDELKKLYDQQQVKCKTAEGKAAAAGGDLEVQQNKEKSEIQKAELALKLAEMDLEKYQKRDFDAQKSELQGDLALKNKALKEAEDDLLFNRGLVKKGFLPLEQLRRQELALEESRYRVTQAEAKLGALVEYEYKRKSTELQGKAVEAKDELERIKKSQKAATTKARSEADAAAVTEKLEKQTLDRIAAQMERCVIKAPQDGIVVYFKRYYDESSRIQPGAVVFYQQPIFTLPDLNHMKVKVKIHESVIKKIAPGQTASLQLDAQSNLPLTATVKMVGTLANSEGWRQTVKEYLVEAEINDLPTSAGLKPGMSAEVKIHVQTIRDTLLVPVQAVTEYEGKPVCYVKAGRTAERRPVEVGEANEQYIQIVSGVTDGEEVALDARSRAAAEVKAARK